MKTLAAIFTLFAISLSAIVNSQEVKQIILEDNSGLLNEVSKSQIVQILATKKIVVEDFLEYEKRCQYFYISITKPADKYIVSARNCDKEILQSKVYEEELKLSSDQGIGLELSKTIIGFIRPEEDLTKLTTQKIGNGVFVNHHDSRHFFAPTAYNLKKGQLYYNTIYLLVHDLQYGVTDNFSIGVGSTIIGFPAYVTPKFSVPISDKASFMIGDLFIFGTWGLNFNANIAYTGLTIGNRSTNVTIAGGLLSSSDFDKAKGLLNVSAMASVSKYIAFITENYVSSLEVNGTANKESSYYLDGIYIQSYVQESFRVKKDFIGGFSGVRFISKNKDVESFQVGFAYYINLLDSYPAKYDAPEWNINTNRSLKTTIFPMVSYTLKFGKVY